MVWRREWRAVWTEKGWRRVQYSEKPFPVFVLMSSFISVMQKNWSKERKNKSRGQKAFYSVQKNNKGKTYGFCQPVSPSGAGSTSVCAIGVECF